MNNRVVVTGIGILSGFGIGKDVFWEGLLSDQSAIYPFDGWRMPEIGCQFVAQIPDWDAKSYLPKLRPPYPSRYSQMAMTAVALALRDAQLDLTTIDATRIGTLLNADLGPIATVEKYLVDLFTKGAETANPLLFARTVANVALGDIARYFQFRGVSSMLIGENSLGYAYELLQDDRADIIVCGGVDELQEALLWSYKNLGLLSSPEQDQPPFQPYLGQSSGMVLGEAVAMLILERYDHAIQRQAKIYSEVLGYATLCDRAANYILSDRTCEDLINVMKAALNEADLSPSDINFVIGCASSHPQLSQVELSALKTLWQDSSVKITSIKGSVGETLGSSGSLGLSAAALSLKTGVIPSCGQVPVDTVAVVAPRSQPNQSRFCLCNSIHMGGNNTTIVLSSVEENE
jgi:3-oxoacyl-[acyl-carrier-protein] synthase II